MRYMYLRFPGGRPKAVTLSYDDARKSDIRFSDMIGKYGIKCTFNINGMKFRGDSEHLTNDEIREYILGRGHEIAVHGDLHRSTSELRPIENIREVLDNRIELENEFGMIIRGMAYPDSGINYFANPAHTYEKVKNTLCELDIAYARTICRDNNDFALPRDWHCWIPTAHHNNGNIFNWIDEFLNIDMSENVYIAARIPRIFYLWGHSFEFDSYDNWDRGEEICKKLSGHDEIWYATNIEIYDYVTAYNSLVHSADGNMIYNPTLMSVWVDIDKKLYEIKSGETLKL